MRVNLGPTPYRLVNLGGTLANDHRPNPVLAPFLRNAPDNLARRACLFSPKVAVRLFHHNQKRTSTTASALLGAPK